MVEAVQDTIAAALSRWTMGTPAASAAAIWKEDLGSEASEAELRLLALSGQFLGVAVTVEPPGDLRVLPDIPRLALPMLPEALRPLLRRLIGTIREARARGDLLAFIARRGRTVHPDDWMPAASDDEVPDVYAPWRAWAEAVASAEPRKVGTASTLSAESWDDFWPAMRKTALAGLRRQDPGAARALLEAKFQAMGAEERLRLLGLLAAGLSETDAAFLQGVVEGDRAPKVKALAAALLGRLGHGVVAGEDAAELAGFFTVQGKGLLRRSKTIVPNPLKTPAQTHRRRQLMAGAEVATFATALQIAPDDLVAMWSWKSDDTADLDLLAMAARSGSDRLIGEFVEALQRDLMAVSNFRAVHLLRPRLSHAQRSAFGHQALALGLAFSDAFWIAGGVGDIDGAIDTKAGEALIASFSAENQHQHQQATELQTLGLIASQAAAGEALQRLSGAGLLGADPRLDMLRLNAALTSRE